MSKKVLLVADDERMNRTVISRFLKNDYVVLEAENGEEAVEILENNHVDIMLLDIIMPKMNGLEVIEYVKKNSKFNNIGILVATSTKEKTERHALAAGADDIVSKPYDPVVIKKRLENIWGIKMLKLQTESIGAVEKEEEWKKQIYSQYNKEINDSIDKVNEMVHVIDMNKDNVKLITECTNDIRRNLDRLKNMIQNTM